MSKILRQMKGVFHKGARPTTKQLSSWCLHLIELENASKRCALGKGGMGVRIGTFRQILIQLGIVDDVSAR